MAFPWLTVMTPGAMFFLMTLFWLLNASRYRLFCPLYLAGKGIGVITAMFWFFFAKSDTIREILFSGLALFILPGIVFFLMLGEALSALLVIRQMRT